MSCGVNEFAFKIATPNGTGSASANSLIMQTIFRMGIPVTGKNLFPHDQAVNGFTLMRVGADITSSERQAIPLLTGDLAKNITALLADGTW